MKETCLTRTAAWTFGVLGMAWGAVAAPDVQTDWLVDPSSFTAVVHQTGDRLVMENGLVSRTLLLAPGVTTWSFRNLSTDEEYVRAPSPEATLTLDGKIVLVGGVGGMPVLGFTRQEDVARYRPEGPYHFTGWRETPLGARLAWKRRPEWSARDLAWPPKGREVVLSFAAAADRALPVVDVHYEIYDGAPLVAKWVSCSNTTDRTLRLETYTSEILRLAEAHATHDVDWQESPTDLFAVSEFLYGDASSKPRDMGLARIDDPTYTTQTDYRNDRLNRLVATPRLPAAATLPPGGVWASHRTWEIAFDSSERERRGLTIRRFWRLVAPWTDENPLIFHLTASADDKVREGIRQCRETGFETLLMSFGSGFNLESREPAYHERYARLSAEAKAAGLAFGGYSLTASRSAGIPSDNVQGGEPRFGCCPCLAARWGQDYLAAIKDFMRVADFGIFENDGPYPGDTCAATNHPGHAGYDDSFIAQWRAQADLYRFCRANGIYVNQPDNYYLVGGSKNGMGYKEVNWSLPRERQILVERQNIYDGTWTKTSSMSWMFVPLAQYHGGGGAATVEPLKDHLAHYDHRFADLLGAGVQACWRGPRLFDTPETLALVRRWTAFYKRYRRVLTGDFIHLRRPDGRDWDGWIMCDAAAPDEVRAIASVFNPTAEPLTRTLVLPLHYAGLKGRARVRCGDAGTWQELPLDARDRGRLAVTIPAEGYLHIFAGPAGED